MHHIMKASVRDLRYRFPVFLYRNSTLEVLQVVAAITLRARFSYTVDHSQAKLARAANLFTM